MQVIVIGAIIKSDHRTKRAENWGVGQFLNDNGDHEVGDNGPPLSLPCQRLVNRFLDLGTRFFFAHIAISGSACQCSKTRIRHFQLKVTRSF